MKMKRIYKMITAVMVAAAIVMFSLAAPADVIVNTCSYCIYAGPCQEPDSSMDPCTGECISNYEWYMTGRAYSPIVCNIVAASREAGADPSPEFIVAWSITVVLFMVTWWVQGIQSCLENNPDHPENCEFYGAP
jgi:hypothetical protein